MGHKVLGGSKSWNGGIGRVIPTCTGKLRPIRLEIGQPRPPLHQKLNSKPEPRRDGIASLVPSPQTLFLFLHHLAGLFPLTHQAGNLFAPLLNQVGQAHALFRVLEVG